MIKLLQESGALSGFNDMASRLASGPRRPLLLAMLMSIIMFVDEYLSVLAVTFALKGTTDRNGIPREHLAFQANAVGCCLCVLVPFSSWVAFTVGLLSDFGLTFDDYISSIPFMFYPVLMFCLLFLLALGIFPKLGTLKHSYERVAEGGPALLDEEQSKSLVEIEMPQETKPSSALNAIIPIVILVAGVLIFDNDLIHGIFSRCRSVHFIYFPKADERIGVPGAFLRRCQIHDHLGHSNLLRIYAEQSQSGSGSFRFADRFCRNLCSGLGSPRCRFYPGRLHYLCYRRMLGNADNRNSNIYSGCNGYRRSCETGHRSYNECGYSWLQLLLLCGFRVYDLGRQRSVQYADNQNSCPLCHRSGSAHFGRISGCRIFNGLENIYKSYEKRDASHLKHLSLYLRLKFEVCLSKVPSPLIISLRTGLLFLLSLIRTSFFPSFSGLLLRSLLP